MCTQSDEIQREMGNLKEPQIMEADFLLAFCLLTEQVICPLSPALARPSRVVRAEVFLISFPWTLEKWQGLNLGPLRYVYGAATLCPRGKSRKVGTEHALGLYFGDWFQGGWQTEKNIQ